ncbi:MAG: hypothetical protein H0V43_10865 [Gemmatimonadales bacterium]|nr:hypothetical protein [Gemmatimonadales bacterium]
MRSHFLLTYDFPPMGGGIARMMGELARRYPPERSRCPPARTREASRATPGT